MGKVADTAVRRRRERRADELARAAAARCTNTTDPRVERERRKAIAGLRRAVRAQRRAEDATAAADDQAATAARALVDLGLTQGEIAAVCGVPLWTVRRLLATRPAPTDPAVSDGDH